MITYTKNHGVKLDSQEVGCIAQQIVVMIKVLISSKGGTGTRVSGTRSPMEKWVEGKLTKAFIHFLPYLKMFQSGS